MDKKSSLNSSSNPSNSSKENVNACSLETIDNTGKERQSTELSQHFDNTLSMTSSYDFSEATNVPKQATLKNDRNFIKDLPDDIFFLIFKFLRPVDLCSVCCVNRRFRHLASKDSVWLNLAKQLVMVMPNSGLISRECSVKDLCRIAPNWREARYKEALCTKHIKKRFVYIYTFCQSVFIRIFLS